MLIRPLAAAALAIAALAVTACGTQALGDGNGSDAAREASNRRAMLDFARCMREHGVDMPDPKFEGGRVTMSQGGDTISPERARAAERACKRFQDAMEPPTLTDAEKAESKKQALAQSRCMREHGIDMPDPVFDENGGARVEVHKGDGRVRPDDPKFRAAERACMPDEDDGAQR